MIGYAAGFDREFEARLAQALWQTIQHESAAADGDAVRLQVNETVSALIMCLATCVVLGPGITPGNLPQAVDLVAKRLRLAAERAITDPHLTEFRQRCFRGDVAGNA